MILFPDLLSEWQIDAKYLCEHLTDSAFLFSVATHYREVKQLSCEAFSNALDCVSRGIGDVYSPEDIEHNHICLLLSPTISESRISQTRPHRPHRGHPSHVAQDKWTAKSQ